MQKTKSEKQGLRSEKVIMNNILRLLKFMGWYAERRNTGAVKYQSKSGNRFVRFGVAGAPDIQAIKNGITIYIEVKKPKGKQTVAQQVYQEQITAFGGMYILARSEGEIIEAVKRVDRLRIVEVEE